MFFLSCRYSFLIAAGDAVGERPFEKVSNTLHEENFQPRRPKLAHFVTIAASIAHVHYFFSSVAFTSYCARGLTLATEEVQDTLIEQVKAQEEMLQLTKEELWMSLEKGMEQKLGRVTNEVRKLSKCRKTNAHGENRT